MSHSIGLCGFCGRPLDGSGHRTCDCARKRALVSTLHVTVARAAYLASTLRPLPAARPVNHYRRALRIACALERTAS